MWDRLQFSMLSCSFANINLNPNCFYSKTSATVHHQYKQYLTMNVGPCYGRGHDEHVRIVVSNCTLQPSRVAVPYHVESRSVLRRDDDWLAVP